ncbi:EVE domain-containing protein [Nostoc sp. LEGE 06077]|uniref:EVE domain-containing protein n=1 Tax=Nostoc sp. LEGE 06077 TaxID=915325 RepID=UPI00187F2578|nr:EVE domain-containing protein [Nostoc sp. LEGE 06077]MBE9206663.1 EVE domain-containing protein [Nostoc sp. LEGE 06077]
MAYWLLKTEPDKYSYADLERDGSTVWDGVTNALALKHIRTMLPGDLAWIYHTGKERQITGLAEIVTQPYQDPALNDVKLVVVKVQAVHPVTQPVTLGQIKQEDQFSGFDLLRLPRLSVVPVSEVHWQHLIKLTASET